MYIPFKYTSFIELQDVYEMECPSELAGACFSGETRVLSPSPRA